MKKKHSHGAAVSIQLPVDKKKQSQEQSVLWGLCKMWESLLLIYFPPSSKLAGEIIVFTCALDCKNILILWA